MYPYSIRNGKILFFADVEEKLSDLAMKKALKRKNFTEWKIILSK